jgi:ligand-binding sensor domain-containing protein
MSQQTTFIWSSFSQTVSVAMQAPRSAHRIPGSPESPRPGGSLFTSASRPAGARRAYDRRMQRLGLVVASWMVAAAVAAQGGGRRPFAIVGPEQGLPSATPVALTQDRDGFIWLGTEKGLVRYEGGRSRLFTQADGLPSAYVSRVLPARDGGLWVATLGGLARLRDGHFARVVLPGASDVRSPLVTLDNAGHLWVASRDGVFTESSDGAAMVVVGRTVPKRPLAIVGSPFSGSVFVATEGPLLEFRGQGGPGRSWGAAEGVPDGSTLVVEDRAGRVWAGSARSLRVKAPGAARFSDVSALLPAALSANSVPFVDADGSVWVPTQGGALHLDGPDRTEMLDAGGGLPFRWVRAVFRDREGVLWVLGPALARLQGGGRVLNYTLSREASGEVVWYVARDRDGRILAATDDGVARLGPSGLERIAGTEGRRIKAFARAGDGVLWMVSSIGPTLWLPPGARRAVEAPLGEFGSPANLVLVDSRGVLWLAHARQGLMRWDGATRRLVQELGPAHGEGPTLVVTSVREDAAHRLWVATSAGLFVRGDGGAWRRFTTADGLRAAWLRGATPVPDGTVWIYYQEPVGITRVRLDAAGLTVLEKRSSGVGLRSDLVYALQGDARGSVWVTSDEGLDRLDPPLHVGRQDGMTSEDCAVQALLVDGRRIWVGTAGGLVTYDVGDGQAEARAPGAHVLAVTFGGRVVEPPFSLPAIPARDASIEFRVAAPSYTNEQDLRFQVRLFGLERDWRDLTSRTAYYPALGAGRYRFQARAARGAGTFGPVAGVEFTVQPTWWRTWWAQSAVLVVGLAGLVGVVRLRERALRRSRAELERLVGERTTELRTRNEELSSALGRVKQLSGLLPICANCKKLRDDKGYWSELESYLTEHTDARFSHGICPDCMKTLYPEWEAEPE